MFFKKTNIKTNIYIYIYTNIRKRKKRERERERESERERERARGRKISKHIVRNTLNKLCQNCFYKHSGGPIAGPQKLNSGVTAPLFKIRYQNEPSRSEHLNPSVVLCCKMMRTNLSLFGFAFLSAVLQ